MKYIPLTKGATAIVDDENYIELCKYKWHTNSGYAVRWKNGKSIFMHREILGLKKGAFTDHINGNRSDNRKQNLRKCTKQQNLFNQGKQSRMTASIFKGITHEYGMWRARIALDGKRIHLGVFSSESEAAKSYNKAATRLYGSFARLNNVT